MRTYKLTISYDGTRYQGWQRQATTDNTIQHILEWSIGKLVGYRVRVDGSGRTDAGVHARGQVASVQLSKLYDVKELKDSIIFTGRYPDHESGTDEKWVPCEKKCKRQEVRILY